MWLPLGEEYRVSMVGRGETPCFFCRGVEPWIFNSWVRLDVPLKFAGKICRKTQKILGLIYAKTLVSGEDFFPSTPLKVRQEAMIMHKKWSSMPAIQLNIYIFCKDVWDIMLGGSFSTYCRGWVELPVATRELQTHLCQKHSMYCCWRVERPPITFGNNFWSWAKTYCGWLQKPAPVDWWQRSHYFGVGFNHPSGAGFLLPSTESKSSFLLLSMKYP